MFRAGLPLALCISLFAAILAFTTDGRATGQSELQRAVESLNGASGAEGYAELRRIWQLWGQSDPREVERALLDASESKRLSPRVRDYASFLLAHARTRRGDVGGAKRSIAELGFVDDWLVLGPFDNEGKIGLSAEYGPETQFDQPFVEGRAFSGKERPVRFRIAPDVFDFGWLNSGSLFRPEQHICFFATTFVSNDDARSASADFFVGVAGAFRFYVNGTLVMEDAAYRGHDIDRRGVEVELPSGISNATVKVCNADSPPIVSLRVIPSRVPGKDFKTSASFVDSQASLSNFGKATVRREKLGALDMLEAAATRKAASADDLENYSVYLQRTQGDDPATHAARDYARRAAESKPTVSRLLLAGTLAEDYNQHRSWTEQAEALAEKTGEKTAELSLARAVVEQGGLNWRDAYPYYVEALRRDPNNVDALTGRVQLLNDAGLHFTALSVLEEAVARNPNAVTLLNLYASELRELGRTQDADDVEARYAQFRFDDNVYLAQKIDLALSRNNREAAEHWLSRLLELNPDSLWARSTAAMAYRRLGQPERAVQTYVEALDVAPEDVQLMRSLADLQGELGDRGEQTRWMQRILELRPQAKEVAEYLAHIEPDEPQRDEAYAWEPDRFLKEAREPAGDETRRTLLDLTVATVFPNGLSSQFRQIVFQPLVDSAAALSRSYSFQYQADTQRVQLRGAKVFRADGRIDEAIETGVGAANDPSIAMYTSARTYNVQFPRLEPGDVVELMYRIDDVTPRNEFADYFGEIQYLQSGESTAHAEYVLITPKSRKFYIDHKGVPGLQTKTVVDGNERIYRFFATDLDAVTPEPMMPPWPEVLGFVHVSTYKDYQQLGKWYWGLSRDQFDLDDETRKLAHEIADPYPTEREKVAAVYNWVIKNTRYVALEFGIYGFKPRRCVQTVSRGWGDCKDKATVIVSLLKELGIDSTIVILRTQMRGEFQSDVASLAPFDHAIAYVPSLDLFLDGTAEYTGTTELPAMDQGALGILVNQGNPKLVTLPETTPQQTSRTRNIALRLRTDGSAQLTADFEVKGTQAPGYRRRYSATSTQRERILSDLSREFPALDLLPDAQGLSASMDDFERPVTIHLKGTAPSYARQEGENLSMPVTTRVRLLDDYAALSQRKLDVRIGAFGAVEDRFEITLPPGYSVEHIPTEANVKTRFGSFSIKVTKTPKTITVESRIALDVTRVTPADYAAWRTFCQSVDNAMNARLVLSKAGAR